MAEVGASQSCCMILLIYFEVKVPTSSFGKKNKTKTEQSFSSQRNIFIAFESIQSARDHMWKHDK